jgi:hypothetical protein
MARFDYMTNEELSFLRRLDFERVGHLMSRHIDKSIGYLEHRGKRIASSFYFEKEIEYKALEMLQEAFVEQVLNEETENITYWVEKGRDESERKIFVYCNNLPQGVHGIAVINEDGKPRIYDCQGFAVLLKKYDGNDYFRAITVFPYPNGEEPDVAEDDFDL